MRNARNLTLCLLIAVLSSAVAMADSPIRLLVQYNFEGLPLNQTGDGVLDPAPPSYVDSALVTASDLGIVQGAVPFPAVLDSYWRDGVIPGQMMSFQQGIPAGWIIPPHLYNYFQYSMTAVGGPVGITSISFVMGHNDLPDNTPHAGIIEYRSNAGTLLGSNTFVIPYGSYATITVVPPATLVAGAQPVFFRIRFNQSIHGPNSWTTQLRLDDVEVWSDPDVLLARLRAYILDQVAAGNIDPRMETSLLADVDAAIAALEECNANCTTVAANNLNALANHTEAQAGKKIEASTAAQIIEQANMTIAALVG